jgi:hypothetical protein
VQEGIADVFGGISLEEWYAFPIYFGTDVGTTGMSRNVEF